MDVLPLPPHPSLTEYKKRAKDLVAAANAHDPTAVRAWAIDWLAMLAKRLGVTITPFVQQSFDRAVGAIEARVHDALASSHASGSRLTLTEAQFLIARAHGFDSWGGFSSHVDGTVQQDPHTRDFEFAAEAVVGGDTTALEGMLRDNPWLISAHSARSHRATLLHYVAANGVEDFRQRTPPNAVGIARLLLEKGAEPDAVANTYGGGPAQTTMNLLVSSTHPAEAGLQVSLVDALLDYGAAINGVEDDASPLMTALAFGYRAPAETLAARGARVDNILAAAALGRTDLVERFVIDGERLSPGVPLVAPAWWDLGDDANTHIEGALAWACKFGREPVVRMLLDKGVSPTAADKDDMTALHWASASGSLDAMRRLLERRAPLEVRNTWGGTVLDSTVYFAVHQPFAGADYLAVIETLIAAGADISEVTPFPTGNAPIDALLRRYGARDAT